MANGERKEPEIRDINALAIVEAGTDVLTSNLPDDDPDRQAILDAKSKILRILLAGEAAAHQPQASPESDNSATQD